MEHRQDSDARLSLPRNAQGLVGRECPKCHRTFRVAEPPGEEQPTRAAFVAALRPANADELSGARERFCPYCGHRAPSDAFLTAAQREYVQAWAQRVVRDVRYEQLRLPERTLSQNPYVTYVTVEPPPFVPPRPSEPDARALSLVCCGERVVLDSPRCDSFVCPGCGTRHDLRP